MALHLVGRPDQRSRERLAAIRTKNPDYVPVVLGEVAIAID